MCTQTNCSTNWTSIWIQQEQTIQFPKKIKIKIIGDLTILFLQNDWLGPHNVESCKMKWSFSISTKQHNKIKTLNKQ